MKALLACFFGIDFSEPPFDSRNSCHVKFIKIRRSFTFGCEIKKLIQRRRIYYEFIFRNMFYWLHCTIRPSLISSTYWNNIWFTCFCCESWVLIYSHHLLFHASMYSILTPLYLVSEVRKFAYFVDKALDHCKCLCYHSSSTIFDGVYLGSHSYGMRV